MNYNVQASLAYVKDGSSDVNNRAGSRQQTLPSRANGRRVPKRSTIPRPDNWMSSNA